LRFVKSHGRPALRGVAAWAAESLPVAQRPGVDGLDYAGEPLFLRPGGGRLAVGKIHKAGQSTVMVAPPAWRLLRVTVR